MRRLIAITGLLGLGAACGSTCETDTPLDHTDDALWLCRPGVGDCDTPIVRHRIDSAGEVVATDTLAPAEDPALACFVVYPTVDLRPGVGLHHQTARVDRPRRWVEGVPRLLSTVCEVWAPVYRQVTIGTYLGDDTSRKDTCLDSARADVDAAFTRFLAEIGDRPFAVVGHSQGAQHLSALLDDRIEEDPALLDRLIVAWPLGWSLGTAADRPTGGSTDVLPVCTAPDQSGCLAGYRSASTEQALPDVGRFAEGEAQVCTHPALGTPDGASAPLSAFVARAADGDLVRRPAVVPEGDLLWWDQPATATCTGPDAQRALVVDWTEGEPPYNPTEPVWLDGFGLHRWDVELGIADVVEDIGRRMAAR